MTTELLCAYCSPNNAMFSTFSNTTDSEDYNVIPCQSFCQRYYSACKSIIQSINSSITEQEYVAECGTTTTNCFNSATTLFSYLTFVAASIAIIAAF